MDSKRKNKIKNSFTNKQNYQSESPPGQNNISAYETIVSIIKEENVNALAQFLNTLQIPNININDKDNELYHTPIFHAVKIKNHQISSELVNLLIHYGVNISHLINLRPKSMLLTSISKLLYFMYAKRET